eukprot:jgi/Botrbrau1/3904/Bobra.0183s0125.1
MPGVSGPPLPVRSPQFSPRSQRSRTAGPARNIPWQKVCRQKSSVQFNYMSGCCYLPSAAAHTASAGRDDGARCTLCPAAVRCSAQTGNAPVRSRFAEDSGELRAVEADVTPKQLAEAERQLRFAQEDDDGQLYGLEDTQRLVETAMLAAVGGLAYALSSILRLQSYFSYLLPMPVVVACVRRGATAGRKTMVSTALLLVVLLGPIQAATYLLQHGFMAAVLGAMWRYGSPWWLSLPMGTAVRVGGTLAYIAL